jgi:glutaredoxin/glutathione-dependent peroxiredoxin
MVKGWRGRGRDDAKAGWRGVYDRRRSVLSVGGWPPAGGIKTNRRDQAMTIKVGDRVPSATLRTLGPDGPREITTDELFRGKKVALFAVPGAFTPACSQRHLPGYVDKAAELKAKGIDQIACVAVNDVFVMNAWGKAQNVGDKVMMLADGSGDFAKAVGLTLDMSARGLGLRSQRYSMLVDNGVVKSINVEPQPGSVEASSAEAMLKAL